MDILFHLIDVSFYADGIRICLFSQGTWVKVISPEAFVEEVKYRLKKTLAQYEE